jgi:hypothetical protein
VKSCSARIHAAKIKPGSLEKPSVQEPSAKGRRCPVIKTEADKSRITRMQFIETYRCKCVAAKQEDPCTGRQEEGVYMLS